MTIFKPTGEIVARRLWAGKPYAEHFEKEHTYIAMGVCRCPTTVEVEWTGGRVAEVSGEMVKTARRNPTEHLYAAGRHVLVFGGVRVRVLGIWLPRDGQCYYRDSYLVMRDGPRAVCAKLYYDAARAFLYKFVRVEAWLRRPKEGECMRAAGWLWGKLL